MFAPMSIFKAFLANSAAGSVTQHTAATRANGFDTASTYRLPYPPLYNRLCLRSCRLYCRNFVRLVVSHGSRFFNSPNDPVAQICSSVARKIVRQLLWSSLNLFVVNWTVMDRTRTASLSREVG